MNKLTSVLMCCVLFLPMLILAGKKIFHIYAFMYILFTSTIVYVLERPRLQSFAFPEISAGKTISVSCTAFEGSKPIRYKWYHNGNEIISSESVSVKYDPSFNMILLSIPNAMPKHSGNYTCVARNDHGVDSFSTMLNIQGRQKIILML